MPTAPDNETKEVAYALDTGGRAVQKALVATLILVACSSFILSAGALIDIVMSAGFPRAVAVLAPVTLDLGAVSAALAAMVRRGRGQRATLEVMMLSLTAAVSVAGQLLHVWIAEGAWSKHDGD